MKRILIFGNSGSGKSTLAKEICANENLAYLDLDTLAWLPTSPPVRQPLGESELLILDFITSNEGWVIEGCYTDLLDIAKSASTEIIFMNLPIDACIENARKRPWEPHKYASKAAQDKNLDMLVEWISQYSQRTDVLSNFAHTRFYAEYSGKKRMYTRNIKST